MKVSELIKQLQRFNGDQTVSIGFNTSLDSIEEIKNECKVPIGVQCIADYDCEMDEDAIPDVIYIRFYN